MALKLSSKGENALRALITLGQHQGELLTVKEIADLSLVTMKYMEQIILLLKINGYVLGKRGANGGYTLHLPPNQINIGEVIRKLEGPLAPMGCVSETAYEACLLEPNCLLKPLWKRVRDQIAFVLDQTTLADLLEQKLTNQLVNTI
ncbi:MAG TPA: Rrf2 family transcriptional regulator [Bacillota bacterium]|nr:Rrf2 family transcriptional regulator [Bacillota bacterium]